MKHHFGEGKENYTLIKRVYLFAKVLEVLEGGAFLNVGLSGPESVS